MNKEEIELIERYEDLINKGYCDCNEMNCLGYNIPKEILRILKKLQKELYKKNNIIEEYKKIITNSYYNMIAIDTINKIDEIEEI